MSAGHVTKGQMYRHLLIKLTPPTAESGRPFLTCLRAAAAENFQLLGHFWGIPMFRRRCCLTGQTMSPGATGSGV